MPPSQALPNISVGLQWYWANYEKFVPFIHGYKGEAGFAPIIWVHASHVYLEDHDGYHGDLYKYGDLVGPVVIKKVQKDSYGNVRVLAGPR